MKILKIMTSAIFMISMIMSHSTSFAANKAAPKTQYKKTTYSKSKRKTVPIPQTKEYKVIGLHAWSEAKRNGFQFSPNSVLNNQNLDGVSTHGKSYLSNHKRCKVGGSQTLGGVNMILNQCGLGMSKVNSYAHFRLFWGKQLKAGWKIKDMKITSSAQWTNKKWRSNTRYISTKIKLTNSKNQSSGTTAQLTEITLLGPKNGKWQDAFDVM